MPIFGSGGGTRTSRPSGYEPDELPTAQPRIIKIRPLLYRIAARLSTVFRTIACVIYCYLLFYARFLPFVLDFFHVIMLLYRKIMFLYTRILR